MESDEDYASSDEEPKKKSNRGKAKKNSSSSASAAKNKSKDASLLKQSKFSDILISHSLSFCLIVSCHC